MKMTGQHLTAWLVPVLVAGLWALPARAADNPDVSFDTFRPSPHPGDILGIMSATRPAHLHPGVGLFATWTHSTNQFQDEDGNLLYRVATTQVKADVFGSIAFGPLDVGVVIPVFIHAAFDDPLPGQPLYKANNTSLGDVRLALKGTIIDHKRGGFGLALAEDVSFPTATERNFTGENGVTATTTLIADYLHKGWLVALNAGYRARKEPVGMGTAAVTNEMLIGLGVNAPLICEKLEAIVTAEMRTSATDPFEDKYHNSVDLMGGVRGHLGPVSLLVAGGAGVLPGYGSPDYRATVGVSYGPYVDQGCYQVKVDDDGDLTMDSEDRCPDRAGPPELGGCPDTDMDGVPDIDDLCPTVKGPAEFRGCPDTDQDGIPDGKDLCPDAAGPAETEGCPDRDKDGVIDLEDRCPDQAGEKENYGCPKARVTVGKDRLILTEKIFFRLGKAVIERSSFALLDDVAKVLKEHSEFQRIRIEGHTDNVGRKDSNMRLSQKRAEAVMNYLVKAGVDKARLDAVGYGDEKPITTNETEDGRTVNRRVEFTLVQDGGAK